MAKLANSGEHGGARLKFLVVVVVLAAVAYAGYLYVPVRYHAFLFKDVMQNRVDAATALGHSTSWLSEQLTKSAPEYDVPKDALITPQLQDGRMEVRVQYTRPIEFPGGFTYEYKFDHTARSIHFLAGTQ
jgi:hypothetical protein